MQEYKGASAYKNNRGSVITIGTFDGVHIGHTEILKRVITTAKKEDLDSILLTFFPHPRMVLQKESEIKLINSLPEKKQLLAQLGLQHLVIHPFTKDFSRLTALEYVRDILVNQLNAKKIIIGYDHRFGRNRTADIHDLKEFGKTYNFEIEEISAQELDQVAVSSTKIRKALQHGNITTANTYLGYNYTITGTIVTGKKIGRTINYPTANLQPSQDYKLIPKNGVYIVKGIIDGLMYYGITNIGTNPTVKGTKQTIETYFLDFDQDLYNKTIQLSFITHIRDEATFNSIEALKSAIQQDEQFARNYITNIE